MEYLLAGQAWLDRRGFSSARLEAEVLLARVLEVDRLRLYLDYDRPLDKADRDRYRELLLARGEGRPLAYLTGEREFFGLPFAVDSRVLIPRPESELLVERALELLPADGEVRFADVGTGSGCLAISIAVNRKSARGVALDLSREALDLAGENARRHDCLDRLELLAGDLLEPLLEGGRGAGSLDLVVANPPYVEQGDPDLDPQVARWEPALALYAPATGAMTLYRRLAEQAARALRPGGALLVECGRGQAGQVEGELEAAGFGAIQVLTDLGGVERALVGRRG